MMVEIPTCEQHEGFYRGRYEIDDKCPRCGAQRGVERWRGFSFDGSRRLTVDCWENACGHIDKYSDVRKEGKRV